MKIVIDIPDNVYDAIKSAQTIVSGQRSGKTLLQILVSSVENGTPLPKNHGRLIDANELLKKSEWFGEKATFDNIYPFGSDAVRVLDIEKAPTIIPAENEETKNG